MIKPRPLKIATENLPSDWHPLVKAIYASRINNIQEIDKNIKYLLPHQTLKDADVAAARLIKAIDGHERILIYGDYDVDGATATALCVRVLKRLGANVAWFIPQREQHGYGLSVAGLKALGEKPDLLLTVDNGIRAHEGVAYAKSMGIEVIISDHHLPDEQLPEVVAVVDPNRRDCAFASKHLAGVGVAFYLLLALREQLVEQSRWPQTLRLSDYLDLVAFGSIADVVPLDHNNRILVNLGIQRMRTLKANVGIRALCAISNINQVYLTAQDIAFALAPRLNAMGRLGKMADGVAMLLSDDWATAQELAADGDRLNRDRKMIENTMVSEAVVGVDEKQKIICVYQPHWHEGVLGIVASRLKTQYSRPVLVGTDHSDGRQIKASLRSLEGVAIDQLLAYVAAQLPAGVLTYGGHAMAAGLSIDKTYFPALVAGIQKAFTAIIGSAVPEPLLYIDGELPVDLLQVRWASYLERLEPWGANLPVPLFANVFELLECRILGTEHSRLILREPYSGQIIQATWFFNTLDEHWQGLVKVVYELQVNRFYGDERLNLLIRTLHPYRHQK